VGLDCVCELVRENEFVFVFVFVLVSVLVLVSEGAAVENGGSLKVIGSENFKADVAVAKRRAATDDESFILQGDLRNLRMKCG